MRILLFTDTLGYGGKERRLLELIKYLKQNTDHTLALVLTENVIYYEYAHEIGIPITIIGRKFTSYDPLPLVKFYRYCRTFKPDVIHAWGIMTTFYAIPAKLIRRIPLISSMIADVRGNSGMFSFKRLFFNIDYYFSDLILSNSKAGLEAYQVNGTKSKVIWNGVYLERFQQKFVTNKVKDEFGVKTDFMIVMVASFWISKDYDLFINIAKKIKEIRDDVTFIAVGDGINMERIQQRISNEKIRNVILTGRQKKVERIIAASDIGLLCTYSEGISNSIIEYMALGKPVISTDITGGSKEIILEGETGYCTERSIDKIVPLINLLLDDSELRVSMGIKGRDRITSQFSISKMGKNFEDVYNILTGKNHTDPVPEL